MKKVIFVCTGNTCRSPLAESYAKTSVNEDITFLSRGLFVMGQETSLNSLKIIEKEGLLLPSLPRQLTRDDLEGATLLTMTHDHKAQILNQIGDVQVYTLSEAANEQGDVSDPYGGTEDDYAFTYQEIRRLIDKIDFQSDIF